jgi:hypothetical protein
LVQRRNLFKPTKQKDFSSFERTIAGGIGE